MERIIPYFNSESWIVSQKPDLLKFQTKAVHKYNETINIEKNNNTVDLLNITVVVITDSSKSSKQKF